MRNTTSVTFTCRPCKVTKAGLAPLEMGITINGKRAYLNLPLKIKPSEFARKRKPEYLQNYLDQTRVRVNEIIVDMSRAGKPLTAQSLREYFRTGGVKSYTVGDAAEQFIQLKRKEAYAGKMTYEHYKKYTYARDLLYKYVNKEDEITKITPALIQNIYTDLLLKYQTDTVAAYLMKLKAIVRYAMDNGELRTNPFQNIKIEKGSPKLEMISDGDLEKIIGKHFDIPRLEQIRDIFLFACGTGLAYCDCKNLRPEDFQDIKGNTCIIKGRQKTGTQFVSVLLPIAKEVAEKYNFDIASICPSNQRLNSYLKEIQDICGVTSVKSLHFHLARRWYSNHLLNAGVRAETVAKAVGHKDYKVLLKYYAKVETPTVVSEITTIV